MPSRTLAALPLLFIALLGLAGVAGSADNRLPAIQNSTATPTPGVFPAIETQIAPVSLPSESVETAAAEVARTLSAVETLIAETQGAVTGPTATPRARSRERVRPTATPPDFTPTVTATPGLTAGLGGGGGSCPFELLFSREAGISADGSRGFNVVRFNEKKHIVVFETARPREAVFLPEHTFGVLQASISPDGRYLFTHDAAVSCISNGFGTSGLKSGGRHLLWDLEDPSAPIYTLQADILPQFDRYFWRWASNEPVAVGIIEDQFVRIDARAPGEGFPLNAPLPPDMLSGESFFSVRSTDTADALMLGTSYFSDDDSFNYAGIEYRFLQWDPYEGVGTVRVALEETLIEARDVFNVRVFSDGIIRRHNLLMADITETSYACTGSFVRETDDGTGFYSFDGERLLGCRYAAPQDAPFLVLDHTGILPDYGTDTIAARQLGELVIEDIVFTADRAEALTVSGPHGILFWWDLTAPTPAFIVDMTLRNEAGGWDNAGEGDVRWLYNDTHIHVLSSQDILWMAENGLNSFTYDLRESFVPQVVIPSYYSDGGRLPEWAVVRPEQNRVVTLRRIFAHPDEDGPYENSAEVTEIGIIDGRQTSLIDLATDAQIVYDPLGPLPPLSERLDFTCEGTLPPQLEIGERTVVTPGQPNNVRSTPSGSAERVFQLEPGVEVTVVDGPVCADGFVWWKISQQIEGSFEPNEGWTVQGNGREYWLIPILGPPYNDEGLFELPAPRPFAPPAPRALPPGPR
jgi:hypothetical protein